MTRVPNCFNCIHYVPGDGETKSYCPAFPDKIPIEISADILFHYKPFEDQVGSLVFESNGNFKNFYAQISERTEDFINRKEELRAEAIAHARAVTKKIFNSNEKNYTSGEIRFYLGTSRLVKRVDEILFWDNNENPELISLGFDSPLFKKLKVLLYVESIESQKTDLEFSITASGECHLNFTTLSYKERHEGNSVVNKLQDHQSKLNLVKHKGLRLISAEQLENKLSLFLSKEDPENFPRDRKIVAFFHEEGYAVLQQEIYALRKKLGYKNQREIRMGEKSKK